MRPDTLRTTIGLGLAGVAAAAVAASSAFGATGGAATPSASTGCSKTTAAQLVQQHDVNHFALPNPVRQVLCGPFTGPGSKAMTVTIGAPTCWPIQHWAVFALTAGAWRLVLDQPAYLVPPLTAAGSGINETTAVQRPGDSRCFPSGGTRSRTWRWNGTRLVASAWTQSKPATQKTPSITLPSGSYFKTPSGNIVCAFLTGGNVQPSVGCRIKSGLRSPPTSRRPECSPAWGISLKATGRAQTDRSVCPGEDEGDAGVLAYESMARVVGYGTTRSSGGIRCTSQSTGLTCRNKSGHGFFLSRENWRAF